MALLDILKMRLWEQLRSIIFGMSVFPLTQFRNNRGEAVSLPEAFLRFWNECYLLFCLKTNKAKRIREKSPK